MRSAKVLIRSLGLVLACSLSVSIAGAGIARVHRPVSPARVSAQADAVVDETPLVREGSDGAARRVRLALQERARLLLAWTHAFGAPLVVALESAGSAGAHIRGISDGPDPIGWRQDSETEKDYNGSGSTDRGRRPAQGTEGSTPAEVETETWQIERRD